MLRICYGHEVTHPDDALLKIVQDALESLDGRPHLVDVLPIREYLCLRTRVKLNTFTSEILSQLVTWWSV